MEAITSEEVELFHSMHEMLAYLNERIITVERELANIRAANYSQAVVIDRAIANLGTIIKEIGTIR